MKEETARLLVNSLAEALKLAADSQLRLAAFERVLGDHNPSVTAAWRKEIETLRKQRASDPNVEALNTLLEQLRLP